VLPIAAIDDLRLPSAPGPVTLRTREALAQAIERELGATV
jgi:branched-chain amino acid aminotransferase